MARIRHRMQSPLILQGSPCQVSSEGVCVSAHSRVAFCSCIFRLWAAGVFEQSLVNALYDCANAAWSSVALPLTCCSCLSLQQGQQGEAASNDSPDRQWSGPSDTSTLSFLWPFEDSLQVGAFLPCVGRTAKCCDAERETFSNDTRGASLMLGCFEVLRLRITLKRLNEGRGAQMWCRKD